MSNNGLSVSFSESLHPLSINLIIAIRLLLRRSSNAGFPRGYLSLAELLQSRLIRGVGLHLRERCVAIAIADEDDFGAGG